MKTFFLSLLGCFVLAVISTLSLPLSGQTGPQPSADNTGATNSPPSGNYPGTGSSITNVAPPAAQGQSPAAGSAGAPSTPPSGVTPGTGTSPNPPGVH